MIAAALLATLAPLSTATADQAAPRRIVSGWMPYWTTSASLASYTANAALISEISPFWFTTTWTGSATKVGVNSSAGSQIKSASGRAALLAQLKAGGALVVPSVTDGTGARRMAAVLADPGMRATHVQQLVDLVVNEGYDGIDIDYETFAFSDGRSTWSSTRPNWVTFMTELGAALHARGKVLTVAVPPQCSSSLTNTQCGGTNGYWVYDFVGIAPAVDGIRVMAYDYSWDSPGPIGPYPWTKAIAQYYASQIPSTKVQIGAPTYGRDWVKRAPGDSSQYQLSGDCPARGTSAYTRITAKKTYDAVDIPEVLAAAGNPPVTFDETYKESTFSYDQKTTWTDSNGKEQTCTASRVVWWGSAQAAVARTELVGMYNLGAVAFWTIGGEDPAQWGPIRAYAGGLGPSPTTLSVSYPKRADYGQPLTITGTAVAAGMPVAGASATLLWRPLGKRKWTSLGTATTGADGVASFRVTPTASGTWRMRVARTAVSKKANTGAVGDTLLRTRVRATLPTPSTTVGAVVPLRGRVAPLTSGQRVRVQVQEGAAWRTVTRGVTNSKGRVRAQLTAAATPGAYTYRVRALKTSAVLAGTSSPLTLTVG